MLRRVFQPRIEQPQSVAIDKMLESPQLQQIMDLVKQHGKEGHCKLKVQDIPFLENCANQYGLVFTQVSHICFLALVLQQEDHSDVSASVGICSLHSDTCVLDFPCRGVQYP